MDGSVCFFDSGWEMIWRSDLDLENKSELFRYEMGKVNEEKGKETTQGNLGTDLIDCGHSSSIDHEQGHFIP
jgi:hypothetical protein